MTNWSSQCSYFVSALILEHVSEIMAETCNVNESFADGNVGAGVRLMVRGGCLPVRGSDRMTWKYDDDKCQCGLVETEKHVLFECTLYGEKKW